MPEEPAERVRVIVDRVLDELDLDAEVEVTETDDEILAVDRRPRRPRAPDRPPRPDPRRPAAALLTAPPSQGISERKRVTVDAAGYRERRRDLLQEEAEIAAERAERNGEPVRLEPMSASERRMVHEVLKERTDVETYSEGDEPERRIVVAPLIDGLSLPPARGPAELDPRRPGRCSSRVVDLLARESVRPELAARPTKQAWTVHVADSLSGLEFAELAAAARDLRPRRRRRLPRPRPRRRAARTPGST